MCVRPWGPKKSAFKANPHVFRIEREKGENKASRARKRKKNWGFSVDDEAEGRRTSHTVHDEAEGQMVHMIVQ